MTDFDIQRKAIVLLSGGADSTLAMRLMLEQGVDLAALNFRTIFCTCKHDGCGGSLRKSCAELGVPLRTVFIGEEYLRMIAAPKHGYGRGMNPCKDCRILMLRRARKEMQRVGAGFLVTGEVLGQRPMSQKFHTLMMIERESGLRGRILRPLSAKLLPPTIPEMTGIVDRSKLLSINGRSRKPQMKLAGELGVDEIPCAAGGCLLTAERFADRVRDLYEHSNGRIPTINDAKLLRVGRHFRTSPDFKIIIGKNEQENMTLYSLAQEDDLIFTPPADLKGPVAIARGQVPKTEWTCIASILLRYCDIDVGSRTAVITRRASDQLSETIETVAMDRDESPRYLV